MKKPLDQAGTTLKTVKSKAGNTVIHKEARGAAQIQTREDAAGN